MALRIQYQSWVLQSHQTLCCQHLGLNQELQAKDKAVTTDCVRWGPILVDQKKGHFTGGSGESNPGPFSMTPVREDMDFNVLWWIGRAVRTPEFYSGYRMTAANQGIKPWDFGLQTGIAPPIPLVRIRNDFVLGWIFHLQVLQPDLFAHQ